MGTQASGIHFHCGIQESQVQYWARCSLSSPSRRSAYLTCLCYYHDCLLKTVKRSSHVHWGYVENAAGRSCEPRKVVINSNTSFSILEDLIYHVVTLPYRTIYQLTYLPVSGSNFWRISIKSPSLVILEGTKPTRDCNTWSVGQSWFGMSDSMFRPAKCVRYLTRKQKTGRKTPTNSGPMPLGNAWDGFDGSVSQERQTKCLLSCFCGLLLQVGGTFSLKKGHCRIHISSPG